MAYGNNRGGEQPRAHFQLSGGAIIKFKHPYFAGMISTADDKAIDEIDISKCCKLEGRFFEATQNQDSARQVVLIDGSTVTICNKMLNGTITIPAVKTTGMVATGDFISACQLIKSVGDSVGGLLTKTDYIDGMAITKVYYGVTVKTCPDDVSEGNDVGVYNVQLLYSGWIEATSSSADNNKKRIWAVGSTNGIEGFYSPYSMQNADGNGATGNTPIEVTSISPNGTIGDDKQNNADTSGEVDNAIDSSGAFADIITDGASITFANDPDGETDDSADGGE